MLVSAIYFAPVLAHPIARVAGGAGDPMLVAYLVTWVAEHLWMPDAWNPPFLHPAKNVLAYSDHLYGLAVMAWPAVAAGAPPTLVVNGIAWAAFFLTSLALFAWLADGPRKIWPACAAAITVSYCAWRTQQLSHPHLIFLPFLPLSLLFFERVIQRRGPLWFVWIGAALLAVQTLSVASSAVFTLPLVAVYLVILLAIERSERQVWIACGMALLAAALCNVPMARHYWALGASFQRNAVEVAQFSAVWIDWISAPFDHWLYGDRLAFTVGLERELFPGIAFLLVTAIGLVSLAMSHPPNRAASWAAAAVAALALWGAIGPSSGGWMAVLHFPYDLFTIMVAGAQNVRVPARLVLFAAIFLAPAIAEGWRCVFDRGRLVGIALVALAFAEGVPGLARYEHVALPDGAALLPSTPMRAVLFVPLGEPGEEIRRMWVARERAVPVVNGYSGHPSFLWDAIHRLEAGDVADEVRRALYSRLLAGGVDTIVVEPSGSPLVAEGLLERMASRIFRIADVPTPGLRTIALGRGTGLLLPEVGWSYPEHDDKDSWVWTLDRHAVVAVPMDGSTVKTIAMRVRALHDAAPLELWWNGRYLGTNRVGTTTRVVTFDVPAEATRPGWNRFEVVGPVPERPRNSEDPRRLSVCVYEIGLR